MLGPKKLISIDGLNLKENDELNVVLKEWQKVCKLYTAGSDGDQACFHRERPNIGFLAAAVWRLKGIAIEEWGMEKVRGTGDPRTGRCDLWFQSRDLELYIEAKHSWINLGKDPSRALTNAQEKLADARHDAAAIPRQDPGSVRLGVLFAAPVVRKNAYDSRAEPLHEWLDGLKRLPRTGLAWIPHDKPKGSKVHTHESLGLAMILAKHKTRS